MRSEADKAYLESDGGTGSVSPVALTLRYARTIKGPAYFFCRLARG